MGCFLVSSVSPELNWTTVMMWLSCLWWISCICLCGIFILYMTPCPMVIWLFQPNTQIFKCYFIYGPVKSLLRDPSLEENTSFFLKWFCCYLGVYLLQPGYILSANKLGPLPGTKVHICPGRMTKIKKYFCGQTWIFNRNKVVFFPGDSIVKPFQNLKSHSGFKKTYVK